MPAAFDLVLDRIPIENAEEIAEKLDVEARNHKNFPD